MGNSASSPEGPSYLEQAKEGYSQLVNSIIRPPRCKYSMQHLGPKEFVFCGSKFIRKDFELKNMRGMTLKVSHWMPVNRNADALPCVVYLHGNASGRIEAVHNLGMVLSLGVTLLAFDFSGSGMSDGEYVSLGHFEKDDLDVVIEMLRKEGKTSTIALWGRSMGAATALMHGERDPSIAGMILDSSFSSLVTLAEELVETGRRKGMFAPGVLVSIVLRWIRQSVQAEANFDINDISPISRADRIFIPALFVAAHGDNFISPSHSQEIYRKYAGDKNVVMVDGDHSTPRPRFLFDSVSIFLVNCLAIPSEWVNIEGQRHFMLPPWQTREKVVRSGELGLFGDSGDPFSPTGINRRGRSSGDPHQGSNRGSQRLRHAADISVARPGARFDAASQAAAVASGGTAMNAAEVAAIQETLFNTFGQSSGSGGSDVGKVKYAASAGHTDGSPSAGDSDSDTEEDVEAWSCPRCTLNNVAGTRICAACETRMPVL